MADAEQQKQGQGKGKGPSKKDRKAQKAAEAEERARKEAEEARIEMEKYSNIVGDLPLIQSKGEYKKRPYISISELNKDLIDQTVLIRARIHKIRAKGGVCFVSLRDRHFTVQATIAKGETIPACFVKFVSKVTKESIVDIEATVVRPNNEGGVVESATQNDIELIPTSFFVVSRSAQTPIVMEDLETPQNQLDEQEAVIAEIEKRMEPLWEEKRTIEEKPQIPKRIVDTAVKNMNAARGAIEKQKKAIFDLQEQLKKAEEDLVKIEQEAEEAVKAVQDAKAKVKEDAALYKQTSEEKARLKAIAAELKPLEEEKKKATTVRSVGLALRLDNRIIDLRTVANQAIFRLQSGVCTLFREVLLKKGFCEIHSPKLIGTASEGGAGVFTVDYFNTKAYLAQSPQLYKQMAVNGDLQKVFEVGPVFRAENSNTHRHMTEFIGLDMEMMFKHHYHEVLEQLEEMYLYIFDGLNDRFKAEIEAVRRQYPFEDLKYSSPSLRLTWPDIIKLLRDDGQEIGDYDDINTTQEKRLGHLVREKHGVDFYVVDKFPLSIRPFYTMPDPEDPLFSNSYDFFLRGEEICSGAQRIHDPELLISRAKEHEVDLEKIQPYIDAFKYGAYPHAGGGVGLERVIMLFLGLGNIRRACLFPRDPQRLAP